MFPSGSWSPQDPYKYAYIPIRFLVASGPLQIFLYSYQVLGDLRTPTNTRISIRSLVTSGPYKYSYQVLGHLRTLQIFLSSSWSPQNPLKLFLSSSWSPQDLYKYLIIQTLSGVHSETFPGRLKFHFFLGEGGSAVSTNLGPKPPKNIDFTFPGGDPIAPPRIRLLPIYTQQESMRKFICSILENFHEKLPSQRSL